MQREQFGSAVSEVKGCDIPLGTFMSEGRCIGFKKIEEEEKDHQV
ncbi:MAG: hypothetical protein QXQ81_03950 [Candidatus Thorarchaeota archaeon]